MKGYLFYSYSTKRPLRWPPYRDRHLRQTKTMRRIISELSRDFAADAILLDSLRTLAIRVSNLEALNQEIASLFATFIDISDAWLLTKDQISESRLSKHDIFQERGFVPKDNLCFVAIPFKKEFGKVLKQSIRPASRDAGMVCKKANDIFSTRGVIQDIWEQINRATVVIADITEENANVFYEIGLSHALGKKVILITQGEPEKIPFDVRHIRCIKYEYTREGLSKLSKELLETTRRVVQI